MAWDMGFRGILAAAMADLLQECKREVCHWRPWGRRAQSSRWDHQVVGSNNCAKEELTNFLLFVLFCFLHVCCFGRSNRLLFLW